MSDYSINRSSTELDNRPDDLQQSLMKRVAAGDDRAFAELARSLTPLLQAIISRAIRNPADVEDVKQETLISLWKSAPKWDPSRGRVVPWAARIAKNRACDHLRKSGRTSSLRDRLHTDPMLLLQALPADSAGTEMLRAEATAVTRKALDQLAPEQRDVIELAFIEGLTHDEVAARTGLPLGTAKSRIRRGIRCLRTTLPRRLAA